MTVRWTKKPWFPDALTHLNEKPMEFTFMLRDIPPRPHHLHIELLTDGYPEPDKVSEEPELTKYVGTVEWSWSPAHSRMDHYYLTKSPTEWVLYLNLNEACEERSWMPLAMGKPLEFDEWTVAFWLIHDFLKLESCQHTLEEFHHVSHEGLLQGSDFRNIARLIWED